MLKKRTSAKFTLGGFGGNMDLLAMFIFGGNMMDMPLDSACWIHYYPPLVQKTRFVQNSQILCFVRNGSRIASDLVDLLSSSDLHLKSTRDRVYL